MATGYQHRASSIAVTSGVPTKIGIASIQHPVSSIQYRASSITLKNDGLATRPLLITHYSLPQPKAGYNSLAEMAEHALIQNLSSLSSRERNKIRSQALTIPLRV
jgi:hypothetical protein